MKGTHLISTLFVLPLAALFLGPQTCCGTNSNKASGSQVIDSGLKQAGSAVREGIWGGNHIQLDVSDKGAAIEYDCAHGTIAEPIQLNSEGRFQAKGTYVPEHGGPVRNDETPVSHPANYAGSVNGKTLTLTVTLTDSSASIGTFTLTQGSEPQLVKCR